MDLSVITGWLSQNWGVLGVLLAGILTVTSDKWLPWVKAKFAPSTAVAIGPSEDADVEDVRGLHLVQARAKRSGCPKFQAAVRDVEVCWFNHAEPAGELSL